MCILEKYFSYLYWHPYFTILRIALSNGSGLNACLSSTLQLMLIFKLSMQSVATVEHQYCSRSVFFSKPLSS